MAIEAGTLILRVLPDLRHLSRELNAGLGAPLRNIGSRFTEAGKALTAGLTLPIVGLGVAAVKTAMDWETAFAGVEKTLDATPQELREIEQGLRDMAKEIPTTAEELAGIAEAAGAMGIAKGDVLSFTRVVADMAETTNLTTESASTAFGQLGNVLNLTGSDFAHLGSTIVDLGNKGASTESEITELMLRLAGTGHTVGLTASEIAGLAASLANAGINAEAGGTAMSRVMQKIEKDVATGGGKLAGFARTAGMSAQEFSEAWRKDPGAALTAFLDGLRTVEDEGGDLINVLDDLGITEARQIDAMTRLAGASMSVSETLGIANSAWRDNNALSTEAEKRYKTTAARFDVFKNTAKDALITLGSALLPVLQNVLNGLKPVIDFVARLFEAFANLPGPVQTFIVVLAGVLAALGPIIIMVGSLISAIGAIAPVVGAIGAALGAAFSPFLLAIAAVVAAVVGLAVVIVKNWDTIKQWTLTAFNAVKDFLAKWWPALLVLFTGGIGALVLVIVKNWDTIKRTTLAVWNAIVGAIRTVLNAIRSALSTYFNAYRAIVAAVWNAIAAVTRAVWNGIVAVLRLAWAGIRAVVTGGINTIRAVLSAGWNAIRSGASAAWDAVVGAFRRAWDTIAGIVRRIKDTFCNLPFVPCSPIPLVEDAKLATKGVLEQFEGLRRRLPALTSSIDVPIAAAGHARMASAAAAGASPTAHELAALREEIRNLEVVVNNRLELDGREVYRSQERIRLHEERART